jgi:SAM-dependent methyltransferase
MPSVEREDWDRRWRERGLHFDEVNRLLAAETEALHPGRALDLGCGAGRNAIWLAERGWQVTGVDFSRFALTRARRLARARHIAVEWVEADLRTYAPPLASFDLVLHLYLHLPAGERRSLLGKAIAALRPGGTVLVIGHDLANLGTGAPGPSDPAVLYTLEAIVAELPGLEIERAECVSRPSVRGDDEVEVVDTVVRARAPE